MTGCAARSAKSLQTTQPCEEAHLDTTTLGWKEPLSLTSPHCAGRGNSFEPRLYSPKSSQGFTEFRPAMREMQNERTFQGAGAAWRARGAADRPGAVAVHRIFPDGAVALTKATQRLWKARRSAA